MSEPKQHARYAASSSDRWLNCPGSVQLSDGAPDQEESAAAEEGTRAHELMEFALNSNVRDVVTFFENEEDKYPLDMREYVQGFVTWVRSQMKPHYEMLVEERVELDGVITEDADPVIKLAFGTVDVAIIEPFGCLHIIDFKYGRKHVPHEDNSQMIYYALGLAHKLKYDFDEIKTTIYQPRSVTRNHPARTDSFGVDKLHKWKKIFADGIKAAEKKKPKLESGEHCFFCPAKITCPAIYKKSLEKAQLDFSSPVQPDPKHLTSDQLRTLLDQTAYLKLWIKEVETYAENRLKSGNRIEGWALEPTRPTRKWKDHVNFRQGKTKTVKHYLAVKAYEVDFLVTEQKSVAEVEKEMKKRKVPSDLIDKFLLDNTHLVSGGVKLSRANTSNPTNDYGDSGPDDLIID